MAYTTDLNTIDNPTSGAAAPATWGDAVRDNFNELGMAWTAYTPTWTASVNPAIGNGTLTGAYRKIGKTLDVRIRMTAGSTTTFGTGDWRFALPAGVAAVGATGLWQVCPAYAQDASTSNYIGAARIDGAGTTFFISSSAVAANWSAAAPFSWGNADFLTITGTIEVA